MRLNSSLDESWGTEDQGSMVSFCMDDLLIAGFEQAVQFENKAVKASPGFGS